MFYQDYYSQLEKQLDEEYRAKLKEWMRDESLHPIFCAKLRELSAEIEESKVYQREKYEQACHELDENKKSWIIWLMECEKKRIGETERQVKRFGFLKRKVSGKVDESAEFDVMGAKAYPIGDILESYGLKADNKGRDRVRFNCFIHPDKTPSMVWYKKENKVHCYSCNFHGDSIDVLMKLYGINFVEAVRKLT